MVGDLRRALRIAVERGGAPVVVVSGRVRRQVRSTLARQLPAALILAEEEVAQEPQLDLFTTLSGTEAARAA